ncbi:MAG: PH domain-containing protein [Candidatus Thorarchaeota archaeon]
MSQPEGINPDERVIFNASCNYRNFKGDLFVTNRRLVFLKKSGRLGTGREVFHDFLFADLQGIRTEKKGLLGVNLAIDHHNPTRGILTYRYSCSANDAKELLRAIKTQMKRSGTPEELEALIMSLIKPKGEADLHAVAMDPNVRKLVARVQGVATKTLSEDQYFLNVKNTVVRLITTCQLDGIITEDDTYMSNAMLGRKSVQYQVVVDFNTLYAQLENKGIVLQTLECPSCNGKLEYPKDGDTIVCQFCNANVHALDIFKKFKDIL